MRGWGERLGLDFGNNFFDLARTGMVIFPMKVAALRAANLPLHAAPPAACEGQHYFSTSVGVVNFRIHSHQINALGSVNEEPPAIPGVPMSV